MLKNKLNGTDLKRLSRNELKKVTGGTRPPGCNFGCSHRIGNGPLRKGCPPYEECITYTCSDGISIGHSCQPL